MHTAPAALGGKLSRQVLQLLRDQIGLTCHVHDLNPADGTAPVATLRKLETGAAESVCTRLERCDGGRAARRTGARARVRPPSRAVRIGARRRLPRSREESRFSRWLLSIGHSTRWERPCKHISLRSSQVGWLRT